MPKRSSKTRYIGITAFTAFVIFAILSLTVFFKVRTVTVKGSSIYTPEDICAASGIKSGGNLIRTNTSKAAEKIESSLIYVEKAKVSRAFPSGIEIDVTPCREAISAQYEEGFCLLSESGKVLKTSESPFPNTIIIYGARLDADAPSEKNENSDSSVTSAVPETENTDGEASRTPLPTVGSRFECNKENRTEIFYELIQVAQGAFSGKANDFDMSHHHNISCVYDGRVTIEFGASTELEYKIKLASKILKDKIGKKTEGTLRMLSNGASFIDKAGIEQNNISYEKNLEMQNAESAEINDNSTAGSAETSYVVHFE